MSMLLMLAFDLVAVTGVLVGAGIVVALERRRQSGMPVLLAFAGSTLLGTALIGFLPEALHRLDPRPK